MVSSGGAFWTDLFLYTNGRCYAQFQNPQDFATSQDLCQYDASPYAGRLATFDSYADYFDITSAIVGYIPGNNEMGTWIGMENQKWLDPNTPSCPPTFNIDQFHICDSAFAVPDAGTVSLGSTWNSWNAASGISEGHMCEFGKKFTQPISRRK